MNKLFRYLKLALPVIVHFGLCLIALASAYNSYKNYLRYYMATSLSEQKAAIKAAMPWVALLFAAWYLGTWLYCRRRGQSLGWRHYLVIFVGFTLTGNLFSLLLHHDGAMLIIFHLAVVYLALLLLMGRPLYRFGRWGQSQIPALFQRLQQWSIAPHLLYLLTVVLCAAVLCLGYLQHQNTLHANGNWCSSKVTLEKGVIGSASFMVTRPALYRNRLNLGAWHGYQEVIYHRSLRHLRQAQFDFALAPGSYAVFVFNKTAAGFCGLRFSNYPSFPSIYFIAKPSGQFCHKQKLNLPILAQHWHHARVDFTTDGFLLQLDGKLVARHKVALSPKQSVGFRGGYCDSYIDNVRLVSADGSFSESFAHYRNFLSVATTALFLVLLINGLLFLGVRSHSVTTGPPRLFYLLAINFLLLFCGALAWLSDYYYFAQRHFKPTDFAGYRNTIENLPQVAERLRSQYPLHSVKGIYRIMFVGSSQTWGAGAQTNQDTFVCRIEKKLNQGPGERYQCINTGISGANSRLLWQLYHQEWRKWWPQLMVINLGNNDSQEGFYQNLEKFVLDNRTHGIRTCLVLEPNCCEKNNADLAAKHLSMKQLARRYAIPMVAMPELLEKHYDDGFLWWDHVHLTSFGQEIFAATLYSQLIDVIASPQTANRNR